VNRTEAGNGNGILWELPGKSSNRKRQLSIKRNWRNKKTHYSADLDRMIMPIGNQISPEVAQGFF